MKKMIKKALFISIIVALFLNCNMTYAGETVKVSRTDAKLAMEAGKGSVDDKNVKLMLSDQKKNAYNLVVFSSEYNPEVDASVTLAKGSKVTLWDFAPKSVEIGDAAKSYISVSSKGVIKAKKATSSPVSFKYKTKNGEGTVKLSVTVVEPSVVKSDAKINGIVNTKKCNVTVKENSSFDIILNAPLNVTIPDAGKVKNKGGTTFKDYKGADISDNSKIIYVSKDGLLHITGTSKSKGSVSIPISVCGKKYTVKIKIAGEGGEIAPAEPNADKIVFMTNGTFTATAENGQAQFIEQWEDATGASLEIKQIDHAGYSNYLKDNINKDCGIDVVLMSQEDYKKFATKGVLWDMSSAYENSSFAKNVEYKTINENNKIDGKLFGFSPAYGNGCVTYVKKAWLEKVGIDELSIKNFDDYYNMLKAFRDGDPNSDGGAGTYGVVAPGFISDEAPYVNYLPEFWQDAYPGIYKNESGKWVDGFQESATRQAILRIKKGVEDDVIDPKSASYGTKDARGKWFGEDQSESSGCISYWAGTWYQTLTDNLIRYEHDSRIIQLEPIQEVGAYYDREAPVYCIIDDGDGDDTREKMIFKTFVETMMDGGEVEMLWLYGAKGVHWTDMAGDRFRSNGKLYGPYFDGEFHLLPMPSDPDSLWKKNAVDPQLVIRPLAGKYAQYADSGYLIKEGQKFFTSHMKPVPDMPSSETFIKYASDITTAKNDAVQAVISGTKTMDQAMQDYIKKVGSKVDQIIEAEGGNKEEVEEAKITFLTNGTFAANKDDGQDAFIEQWENATKTKLEIQQIDHSGYSDYLKMNLKKGCGVDVVLLSSDDYKKYASEGLLWDMTSAYSNAKFKNSVKYPEINEQNKISGKLYGFSPAYGNGCVTYIKKSWLNNVGINASSIKNFDDYYNMLKAFRDGDPDGDGIMGNTYGVVSAGLVSFESPYVNYLPEFWQDAFPGIYLDETGNWIDGFQTEKSKLAIQRIADGVSDGVIDPGSVDYGTRDAREKWFGENQTGSSGCFTYWAGTWYQTLADNLIFNNVNSDVVEIAPIAEVGAYYNREAPVYCIIDDGDGDNTREQSIFDTFFESMMDGGEVEMLWLYGAKGVHWSDKADNGFSINGIEYGPYYDGEFHLLPTPSDPDLLWKKNAVDPQLVICPLKGAYKEYADTSEVIEESNAFFTSHMKPVPQVPSSELYIQYASDIGEARENAIKSVISGTKTVDEAITTYKNSVGNKVDQIIADLNK